MLNFRSEDMRRNPYPVYDRIRSGSPVFHESSMDAWMLFSYDDVKRALSDHDSFSSAVSAPGTLPSKWFIFLDPPRHTKLRGLIMRAFTPKMVANLEPAIRQIARELLDQTIEHGAMDFVSDFAVPLPMMVIARMLGIPAADWPRFSAWGEGILKLSYTISGADAVAKAAIEEFKAVAAEMREFLALSLDERRAAPKDDLLTKLVEAEIDGDRLTGDEILGFFQLLLIAGTETTTNLLGNSILSLIENPDQLARLIASPELLPAAVEEVLRYRSPVQWMLRVSKKEINNDGHVIPAGRLVIPVIGSANRDPKQFRDAGRFDITREPNPHIAFGHGIHFCLGAPLARLEAKVALSHVLERLERMELAGDQPWQPRSALHVQGPAHLAIRFKPGQKAAAEA